MRMWRFANEWDYHQLGAFIVLAESAEEALDELTTFLAINDRLGGSSHYYVDGIKGEDFTAEEAEELGTVWVVGGCDD